MGSSAAQTLVPRMDSLYTESVSASPGPSTPNLRNPHTSGTLGRHHLFDTNAANTLMNHHDIESVLKWKKYQHWMKI